MDNKLLRAQAPEFSSQHSQQKLGMATRAYYSSAVGDKKRGCMELVDKLSSRFKDRLPQRNKEVGMERWLCS